MDLNAQRFYDQALTYQIDPGFALAVWVLETGWGKSSVWLNDNNPAGIVGSDGDYCAYSSKEDGIHAMFELLNAYTSGSISYVGQRDTAEEIRAAWSQTDDVEKIVDIWRLI